MFYIQDASRHQRHEFSIGMILHIHCLSVCQNIVCRGLKLQTILKDGSSLEKLPALHQFLIHWLHQGVLTPCLQYSIHTSLTRDFFIKITLQQSYMTTVAPQAKTRSGLYPTPQATNSLPHIYSLFMENMPFRCRCCFTICLAAGAWVLTLSLSYAPSPAFKALSTLDTIMIYIIYHSIMITRLSDSHSSWWQMSDSVAYLAG